MSQEWEKPPDRARIYVVEDETLIRRMIEVLFRADPDFEIVGSAATGAQALEELAHMAIDAVVMDIGLPDIDGIECTRRLLEQRPGLKVIVLTSFGDEMIYEALQAGAAGYILKTAEPEQLARAIRYALKGGTPIDPTVAAKLAHDIKAGRQPEEPTLTPRQREILKLAAEGYPYSYIASQISVSLTTVNREMATVFERLGCANVVQAVAEASKRHLI